MPEIDGPSPSQTLAPKVRRTTLQARVDEQMAVISDTLSRLTASERFKQAVIDALPASIAVIDRQGIILAVNKPWLELGRKNDCADETCISTGIDYLALCRKAFSLDTSCSESARTALQGITAVLEGKEYCFVMDYACHGPSQQCWYQMSVMRPGEDFDGAVIAHIDISARKKLEEERRIYTAHLIEAIEQERVRIARELHDSIGQSLTLFSFDIARLQQDISPGSGDVTERLAKMGTHINTMVTAVQRICSNLRPPLLEELGLEAAIEWLVDDFSRRSGIPCAVHWKGKPCSQGRCVTELYRVTQESLTNISKHAHATAISVSFTRSRNDVVLTITDNGCGFIPGQLSGRHGFGLIGMRERVASLGGTFTLRSDTDKGTNVAVKIPCRKKELYCANLDH